MKPTLALEASMIWAIMVSAAEKVSAKAVELKDQLNAKISPIVQKIMQSPKFQAVMAALNNVKFKAVEFKKSTVEVLNNARVTADVKIAGYKKSATEAMDQARAKIVDLKNSMPKISFTR
ncbi:MAG: hypothetical protein ACOYK9_06740 [Chlamydiia bacterium]